LKNKVTTKFFLALFFILFFVGMHNVYNAVNAIKTERDMRVSYNLKLVGIDSNLVLTMDARVGYMFGMLLMLTSFIGLVAIILFWIL